jgi:hypothetical protein
MSTNYSIQFEVSLADKIGISDEQNDVCIVYYLPYIGLLTCYTI